MLYAGHANNLATQADQVEVELTVSFFHCLYSW